MHTRADQSSDPAAPRHVRGDRGSEVHGFLVRYNGDGRRAIRHLEELPTVEDGQYP
jgi:hypothetical protein